MWILGWNGASGFSGRATAEQVAKGIDASGLTAIVTGTDCVVFFIFYYICRQILVKVVFFLTLHVHVSMYILHPDVRTGQ